MNIKVKLLITFLPLVVLPLIFLGGVSVIKLRDAAYNSVITARENLLTQLEVQILSAQKATEASVKLLAGSNLIQKYVLIPDEWDRYSVLQPTLLRLLIGYQEIYPDYSEIRIFLPDGYEDTRVTIGDIPNKTEMEGDSVYFKKILQSQAPLSKTLFKNEDTGKYAFLVSKRLNLVDTSRNEKTSTAKLRGVLAITLDLDWIDKILNKLHSATKGNIFLVCDSNVIIASSNQKLLDKEFPASLLNKMQRLTPQPNENSTVSGQFRDEDSILQYRKIEPDLFLVSSLSKQELISDSLSVGKLLFFMTLLCGLVVCSLLLLGLRHFILSPIGKLTDAFKTINLEEAEFKGLTVTSKDEFGVLADNFNLMGERLHEYHNRVEESRRTLVSQVEERTKDLKQAKEEAEAANKAKSDFLANMSHELRTPLNHIIGFTELVTEEHFGELNPTQKEYLTDALQGSQHLLSLINDILDISKVEAGKMELRAAPIELPVLISNSLIMIKEKALKHSIKVTADLEQLPATIQADGRKLKQVMYNLLSNAEKFTPEKGAIQVMGSMATITDGSVQTSDGRQIPLPVLNGKDASGKRSFARIAVQDTGIGLAADKLDLIFGAFDQVETSRSRMFQGTGLGLALTKRFVELHGGTIWAESEGKGKGCRLIFVLPAEG